MCGCVMISSPGQKSGDRDDDAAIRSRDTASRHADVTAVTFPMRAWRLTAGPDRRRTSRSATSRSRCQRAAEAATKLARGDGAFSSSQSAIGPLFTFSNSGRWPPRVRRWISGPRRRGHREEAGTARFRNTGERVRRELLLPNDALVEPRASAARQNRREHGEGVVVRRRTRRYVVRHVETRETSERVVERRAPLFGLRRLAHVHRRRRGLPCDAAKVFLHFLERRLRVHVADDRDDGVVGRVVHMEEVRDVLHGRGAQVGHGADHRMRIGEIRVGELGKRVADLAVRLIVDAEAALFLDGVDLVVEVVLGDRERLAIGLEEQRGRPGSRAGS